MKPKTTNNKNERKILPVHMYFSENCKRFLKETSLDGLKYIGDTQRNIWQRCYYLISFSAAFTTALTMALYFWQKWQQNPVIITINSKGTDIQELPFPTVTFCNMNQAQASRVQNIEPDTAEYAMLQNICFRKYNYSRYENYKPQSETDNFVNFIIKNAQSCKDMMIYCKYGPNEETCSDLFREVFLDEGMCCVFNQLHPYFLYTADATYIHDYTSTNGRTSIPVNWNLESGYPSELPKSYYPRRPAGLGVSMGLTVVLNANTEEYYCSSTNGPGFKYLLYNPMDSGQIKEIGIPIILGHQTRVRITTKRMESASSLRRNTRPKDRHCYFSDEKPLLYFKYYTRLHCDMECEALEMLR